MLLKVGSIQETFTAGDVQGLGTHEMEDIYMPDLASEFEEEEDYLEISPPLPKYIALGMVELSRKASQK